VILAIDPALHTSGAVILIPDTGGMDDPHPFKGDYVLYEFGVVRTQSERERYITSMLELSEELDLPPVVIAEIWDGPRDHKVRMPTGEVLLARDQKWTYTTILGIGEGWGRWSAEIEAANEFRREESIGPDILLERVSPNDWRDAVFGPRRAKDTESLKTAAQKLFEGVFGYPTIPDVAEAGCIGLYGLKSPALAERVVSWAPASKPKKRRRKAS
jgi:hypothetical protein